MSGPDITRLQRLWALDAELERLAARGELTKETFQRIWLEGAEALGPERQDGLEAFVLFAEAEDWIPDVPPGEEGEGDDPAA